MGAMGRTEGKFSGQAIQANGIHPAIVFLDQGAGALRVTPSDPEAHLERGIVYRLQGRSSDARTEFLAVLVATPEGEVGDAARFQIERLELGLTDPTPPPPTRKSQ